MSAWTTGIGLGLEAARMRQQRDQFAQEQAFRQQQAAIDNQQRDRAFGFNEQQAAINNAQQDRHFQAVQQQIAQQFAERKAALDRDLMGQQATAQVFKAISAPDQTQMMPGIAMGEGSQNYNASAQLAPHPSETLDFNTISSAAPQALNALVGFRQNRAELQKRRQFAVLQAEAARADGSLKLVDPRTAKEWADLGLYSDGTIRPDEMPLPLAKQLNAQRDAMAEMLATQQGPDGSLSVNPDVFERLSKFPPETLKMMYEQQNRMNAAVEVAKIRQMAKGAAGPTIPQRLEMAKASLATAQREYLAAAGKNGKAGILAEPTQADYDLAATADGDVDAGWWDPTGPQKSEVEAAKKKIAAWEKYKTAADAVDSVRMGADADLSQRGLLDTADQTTPVQQPDAVDALIDQLMQPQ